ncbi:unnamed protein product [Bursaphelenchus okinawaensis]|uniref:Uncharacterized protein n=1 Tax=Bursaphelenchus okinawaensis TaxID=465554 RepID=A0A811LGA2_9BILA|nr:unnamed protein product [Bursaphelenchus okinawaensis]CAG9121904.1 unnamed protein product [Bursaphelenchus okinawaensis]
MISIPIFFLLLPIITLSQHESPFAARPLRIRLVNYEKRYQVRHAATPFELSGSTNTNSPSIEFSEDSPSNVVSSQSSYLHSIRKRIRGTKLHTVSTALSHLSSAEPLEGMREVDGSNENIQNSPEKAVKKLFEDLNTTTTQPQVESNDQKVGKRNEKFAEPTPTNSGSTKFRAPVNKEALHVEKPHNVSEIIQEPPKGNQSMTAMTELDVKSDEMLQKTFRRTTLASINYKDTTTPLPKLQTLPTATTPVSSTGAVFTLPPLFAAPNLELADPPANSRQQPLAQLPTSGFSDGGGAPVQHVAAQFDAPSKQPPRQVTPSSPSPHTQPQSSLSTLSRQESVQSTTPSSTDLEQLGCGFDLLTQTCKDVFGLGWCSQCTDLGNVFLHDCKCAAPTELGRTANALFTQPPSTTPYDALGQQSVLQQQIAAQQNALAQQNGLAGQGVQFGQGGQQLGLNGQLSQAGQLSQTGQLSQGGLGTQQLGQENQQFGQNNQFASQNNQFATQTPNGQLHAATLQAQQLQNGQTQQLPQLGTQQLQQQTLQNLQPQNLNSPLHAGTLQNQQLQQVPTVPNLQQVPTVPNLQQVPTEPNLQLNGQLPQQISSTQHLVPPQQFAPQFAQLAPQLPQPQALSGFVQQPTWAL